MLIPAMTVCLALLSLMTPSADAQTSTGTGPAAKALVISGSGTVYPLITEIARRFERVNAGIAIEVRAVGSGRGIADLRAGASDIAMVARALVDNERDLFGFPLCRGGAGIVVHSSNPVKNMTSRQLTAVLIGNITEWKQLGGRPGAIRLAWRTEGQAIPEILQQQLRVKPEQIRSQAMFSENADAVKFAASDRNAITFTSLGVAEHSAKSGVPIKLLLYEGIAGSTRSVRDHTYALSRPLLLVTRRVPMGLQKRFVDYAVSGAVNDLHEKHGFVPYK